MCKNDLTKKIYKKQLRFSIYTIIINTTKQLVTSKLIK